MELSRILLFISQANKVIRRECMCTTHQAVYKEDKKRDREGDGYILKRLNVSITHKTSLQD